MISTKNIHPSWQVIFEIESKKEYFQNILQFLQVEKSQWKMIFPNENAVFRAFETTSFDNLKIVIIGQDPYHWKNQANGLAFSVSKDTLLPPSLKNIYKELNQSLGIPIANHGDFTSWAEQWVLLLNSVLTVEKWLPASHSHIGWQQLTDTIIRFISENSENIIFLLWWNFAQNKENYIDANRHFILKTSHPSPFSVHRGFLGSKCFQKANEILNSLGKKPIDWNLNDSLSQK